MAILQLVLIFLCTGAYAIYRYAIQGTTDLQNTPVYLFNKALAFSIVIHFLFLFISKYKNNLDRAYFWGKAILHFSILHSLISATLISPLYYPSWYSWQKMNWTGEFGTLFGVLAFYFMIVKTWMKDSYLSRLNWDFFHFILLFTIGAHIFSLGLTTWMEPDRWHGGLPPISLLSFGLFAISFLFCCTTLISRKGSE